MIGKIAAGVLTSSFYLAFSQGAQAHFPDEGPQHDLLAPHAGFVMKMKTPSGGSICCNFNDAHGNVGEERYTGADGMTHYRVRVPDSKNPGKTRVIEIPPEKVLTSDMAKKYCDEVRESQPESEYAQTCVAPAFNLIWYNEPHFQPYSNIYIGQDTVYCYYPKPDLQ